MGTRIRIIESASGTPLSVVGTRVIVLKAAEQPGDDLQVTLQSGEAGSGPPPHRHDWAEAFYVTRGAVDFQGDGVATRCAAGTLVFVPPGCVHAFSYAEGGGEMIEMTGLNSRAVEMFRALDHEIPPGPPDVDRLVAILDAHGVRLAH